MLAGLKLFRGGALSGSGYHLIGIMRRVEARQRHIIFRTGFYEFFRYFFTIFSTVKKCILQRTNNIAIMVNTR